MYITFSIARFNYEKLSDILPQPTAVNISSKRIEITYSFGQKLIGGRQIMRVGLIKKSIENIFDNEVTWLNEAIYNDNGYIYRIDEFYNLYCKYKSYPKWMWPKHRKDLMQKAMWYAVRLHEKGLFCFETVLGSMYIMNQHLPSKITKYEVLEKKARWITAKMYERIDSGEFQKLSDATLHDVRVSAGKKANKASISVRQSQAHLRRQQIKQLLHEGITDIYAIAGRVGVNKATVYRDLKILDVDKY